MYLVLVSSASWQEYLVAIYSTQTAAEDRAATLRPNWYHVRVSAGVNECLLLGTLVDRWESA